MARRAMRSAFVATSVLLGVPAAGADAPPPPQLPLPACSARVNDAAGDGTVDWSARPGTDAPVADPRGSLDALDITAVTFRLTKTRVFAFMTLKDIPTTMRETDSAYGYYFWFTSGAKMARFDAVLANPSHAPLGQPQGYPTASVGTTVTGGPNPLTGLGGGVDKDKNVVYVYADRASLEDQLGGPLADGDRLTAITGKTVLFVGSGATASGVTQRPADKTTVPAADAVQAVGDDPCFAASRVAVPQVVTAQYGDPVTLRATLADADGVPLAGRQVTFQLAGSAPLTLTTDADGGVATSLAHPPAAVSTGFDFSYDGDELSGRGHGTGVLTVRPETILVAPLKVTRSGTARTVTATLTEDDPRPFSSQPVDWYVNGKKVARVTTDAAGRSVFKGAKAGQKVQARYAGSATFAAAKSGIVTA
jgi:hypothetical protein